MDIAKFLEQLQKDRHKNLAQYLIRINEKCIQQGGIADNSQKDNLIPKLCISNFSAGQESLTTLAKRKQSSKDGMSQFN